MSTASILSAISILSLIFAFILLVIILMKFIKLCVRLLYENY